MSDTSLVCPLHPERKAHAVCSLCGTYMCERCSTPVPRSSPMCEACDARLVEKSRPLLTRAARWLVAIALLDAVVGVTSFFWTSPGAVQWPVVVAQGADLALFVAYAVWCFRANHALRARGYELEFGPHAWGWNLVPGANLYVPYRVLRELFERAVLDVGFWIPVWWLLQLSHHALRFFMRAGSSTAMGLAMLCELGATLILIVVVVRTTRGLSTVRPRLELAPVGHVESEPAFASFL